MTGAKSTVEWLRGQGTGAGAARRQVHLAQALVEHTATLAAPRPCTEDGPDPRTAGRRRGQAPVQLAQLAPAGGLLPVDGAVAATVLVTMTLDQLTGGLQEAGLVDADRCAVIAGGTVREPISAALARQIACEAGIIPVVLGRASEVLDLGRSRRLASPAQRKAVTVRDQGCSRPRCDTPPGWTQAHHVTKWQHGGRTNVSGMTLVCDHCHDLVHHHQWTITMTNGQPQWHPPPDQPPPEEPPEQIP